MSPVLQPAHTVSRPGHDMCGAGHHLLLTARAPEGLRSTGAADPADEPFAVAVGLAAWNTADGTFEVELGALGASAMWSGHVPIVAVPAGFAGAGLAAPARSCAA